MRIVFMGTPDFAVPALQALHAAGHDIVAVYSQPPRPAGRRGLDLTPSPVHKAAEALGVTVFTPLNFKASDDVAKFQAHQADVAVVAAYGLLLPQVILEAPKLGCLNIHASLLPRWRGAAPIHRAIMAGDETAGITIMQMELGLDTGPMGPRFEIAITPSMTTGALHDVLSSAGGKLIVDTISALEKGSLEFEMQPDIGVTYAKKIDKAEARIDWSMDAENLRNHIHGLSPFPGAWCMMMIGGKAHRVKILAAQISAITGSSGQLLATQDDGPQIACGRGSLILTSLQKAGSSAMSGAEFLRGNSLEGIEE